MAITLNDNIYNYSPKSLDAKYTKLVGVVATPYASVSEANATIPSAYRSIGLTVNIAVAGINKEYWYKQGILDADLVLKELSYVTADNGLTMTGSNIQLGGNLVKNTFIDATAAYRLIFLGANQFYTLSVQNTSVVAGGYALNCQSTGVGGGAQFLTNSSISGVKGVDASSGGTGGIGVHATGNPLAVRMSNTNSATNDNVLGIAQIQRTHFGTVAVGIGAGVYFSAPINGAPNNADLGQLSYSWTDVTNTTRVSKFVVSAVSNAITNDVLSVLGTGSIRAHNYGIGAFTGTVTKLLGVTSTGDIVETTTLPGSASNTIYTADDTITGNRVLNTGDNTFEFTGGVNVPTLKITGTAESDHVLRVEVTPGVGGNAAIAALNDNLGEVAIQASSSQGPALNAYGAMSSFIGAYNVTPDYALSLYSSDNVGTGVMPVLKLVTYPDSGGPPTAGLGTSIDFQIKNDTYLDKIIGRITSVSTDVTNATEAGNLVFSAIYAGALAPRAVLSGRGEFILGDDLTPSGTAFFRVNKTFTDYVPAFIVEESAGANNYILGQFKGQSNQLYVTTTNDDTSCVFNDAAGNNYLIIGSTPSQGRAWIRTENAGGPLDFETNAGTKRARMTQAGNWTFNKQLSIGSNVETTTPTANVDITGGTATAGTAPLKVGSGVLLTAPEASAVENNGTHLYWTNNSGRRLQLDNTTTISTIIANTTANFGRIYLCNTTASGFTITVDTSTIFSMGTTETIIIKKISNDVNTVTITPSSGTIDGAASATITAFNNSVTVVSDGTNLFII